MVTIFYTDDSNCGRGDAERVESATDASAARAGPLSRRSPHPAQFHQTVRCRRQPTPIHQSTGYLFIRCLNFEFSYSMGVIYVMDKTVV